MHYIATTARCYLRLTGVLGLMGYVVSKITGIERKKIKTISDSNARHPVKIRVPSSDVYTYCQIFIEKEYKLCTTRVPEIIIDAGSNIGLASVYFASLFPDAKIIAIEPEESNFEILKENIANYKNITAINAALWKNDSRIRLTDPGLGHSGFMTEGGEPEASSPTLHSVQGITIGDIMKEYSMDKVDILKIDIEGAEKEVLESSSSWIDGIDSMIVELHERMKPGCNRSFAEATNGFDHKWSVGENIFVSRANGCLTEGSKQ